MIIAKNNIKKWQKTLRKPSGKTWNKEVVFSWTPGTEYVSQHGGNFIHNLDIFHKIPEINEDNNHMNPDLEALTIIVSPKFHVPTKLQLKQKNTSP